MRFFYLTVILAGVLILLNLGGFQTPTTGSILSAAGLINSTGTLSFHNVMTSSLFGGSTVSNPGLYYLLLVGVAAGVVLGAFGRTPDVSYIVAGLVWVIVSLLAADIIYLGTTILSFGVAWITGIGTILAGISLIVLFISAIEFWRGND